MSELPFYIVFVIVSLIVSLLFYKHNRNTNYLKVFPFFLAATIFVEWFANELWMEGKPNAIVYNFFTLIEFVFYFFILHQVVRSKWAKKVIFVITVIYIPVTLLNIFFIQGLNTLHTVTYSMGCLLVVAFSIFYFYELFKSPQLINLSREPGFWISSGLLFFYCCTFPYYALTDLLQDSAPFMLDNFGVIVTILNILLYILFTIAFVCRTRVRKSTSLS